MSTVYENAIDVVRETGARLARELPTTSASDILASHVEWPEDLAGRVTDEVVHGIEALKGVVGPVAAVAVGAGGSAATSGGRLARRHPAWVIGGSVALFVAVVWIARRRRSVSDDRQTSGVESEVRPITAA